MGKRTFPKRAFFVVKLERPAGFGLRRGFGGGPNVTATQARVVQGAPGFDLPFASS